jgi:hypothetical protein
MLVRRAQYCLRLLLDPSDGLEIGRSVEGVSSHEQQLDQVPSDVTTGDIEAASEMGESVSLIDGHDVGDSISRIDDDSSLET